MAGRWAERSAERPQLRLLCCLTDGGSERCGGQREFSGCFVCKWQGERGAGRSLVTAIRKGLVTTFLLCFGSGGIVFWQEILKSVCVGKGRKHPREQKPPEPLVRAGAAGPLRGRGCSAMSCTAPRAAVERLDAPLSSPPRAHAWSVHRSPTVK